MTTTTTATTPTTTTPTTARQTWRFSADHITAALAHCTPARSALLLWAYDWCLANHITYPDFCKQLGYAPNTLYKIYTGKHTNPNTGDKYDIPDKLYTALQSFKQLQLRRAALGHTQYISTPTARKIHTACDLARESRTPVFIWGASHLGKTWALKNYQQTHHQDRTIYIRIPAKSGLKGLVQATATAIGVPSTGTIATTIQRIKNSLASNHLLIFDEVHQLQYAYRQTAFYSCIEILREIYDHVECGLVLCTTNVFRNRFEAAKKAELEQLFRRGVHQLQIGDEVRTEDLLPILAASGLDLPLPNDTSTISGVTDHPYTILRTLAKQAGLKAITERLRYARLIASKTDTPLTWDHFLHAHLIITTAATAPPSDWQ